MKELLCPSIYCNDANDSEEDGSNRTNDHKEKISQLEEKKPIPKRKQTQEVDIVLNASFIKAWSKHDLVNNQTGYSDKGQFSGEEKGKKLLRK